MLLQYPNIETVATNGEALVVNIAWNDMAHAIWEFSAPLKLSVASDPMYYACAKTDGQTGWFVYDVDMTKQYPQDHCVSANGYGQLAWLFKKYGISLPAGVGGTHWGFAIFSWGSIGSIDRESLFYLTGEAWVRHPTTILTTAKDYTCTLPASTCQLLVKHRPSDALEA